MSLILSTAKPLFSNNFGPFLKRNEEARFCVYHCQLRHNQIQQSGDNLSSRFSTREEIVRHFKITTLTTVQRAMSADSAPVAWILMLAIGIDTNWSVIWASSTIYTTCGAELKLLSTEAVLLKPNTLNQRTPGQTVFFVRAQSAFHKPFFRRGNLPICAQFLNSSCLLNLRVVWPDTCNDVSKSS